MEDSTEGRILIFYHAAVHIEPPVTDEVLLVVESSFNFCLLNFINFTECCYRWGKAGWRLEQFWRGLSHRHGKPGSQFPGQRSSPAPDRHSRRRWKGLRRRWDSPGQEPQEWYSLNNINFQQDSRQPDVDIRNFITKIYLKPV